MARDAALSRIRATQRHLPEHHLNAARPTEAPPTENTEKNWDHLKPHISTIYIVKVWKINNLLKL